MALISLVMFVIAETVALVVGFVAGRFCPMLYLAVAISVTWPSVALLLFGSEPITAFIGGCLTFIPSIGGCIWGRSCARPRLP